MNSILQSQKKYFTSVTELQNLSCKNPSRWIEIQESGDITICCYTWLPVMIGNILELSTEEIFNNAKRNEVLDNISKGDFSKCTDHCPHLNNYLDSGKLDPSPFSVLVNKADLQTSLVNTPWSVRLSYDRSCNLQCPSCRKNLILLKPEEIFLPEVKKLVTIHNKVKELINYLISRNEPIVLTMTGSGDAFASPIFWSYLVELSQQELPKNFYIKLMTNGILMTEQHWNEIKPLWKHIVFTYISIDAASESTYKIVRKNGNFSKLKNNLSFLNSMFKENAFVPFSKWTTAFVVQKENYNELKDFVEWQLSYDTITNIEISLIAQWGHLSDQEYSSMLLNESDKKQLSKMLADPIFNDPRISLGSINQYKNISRPL
jgi:MoaA/NifB/PqqE/SkfB family radical SAM enzyme